MRINKLYMVVDVNKLYMVVYVNKLYFEYNETSLPMVTLLRNAFIPLAVLYTAFYDPPFRDLYVVFT